MMRPFFAHSLIGARKRRLLTIVSEGDCRLGLLS